MASEPQGSMKFPPPSARRVPIWVWLIIAALGLIVLFAVPRLVMVVGLVAVVAGLVILKRGAPTWLRVPRGFTVAATVGAGAVFLAAAALSAAPTPQPEQHTSSDVVPFVAQTDTADTTTPPASTFTDEVVTETIPFEQSTVEDAGLPSGQTQVVTAGVPGERTLTYRVEYLNGREVGRDLVSDVITIQPVAQVTAIGTYVAPPPPPPPPPPAESSGCDPNYADACVPISTDVDCAWGSGNGPDYFDGVARVVGADIYDLDRDGDGYACEQ